MSNDNLRGHTDRRIPVRKEDIRVRTALDAVYKSQDVDLLERDRTTIENQSFRDAVKKLNPSDEKAIQDMLAKFEEAKFQRRIRGFGETAAYELLGKIGIYFFQVTNRRAR